MPHHLEWALGEQLYGDSGDDVLIVRGPGRRAFGGLGSDRLRGSRHFDWLYGGAGADVVFARGGDDHIFVRDGVRDVVSCGRGDDRVTADRLDRISRDCERVLQR